MTTRVFRSLLVGVSVALAAGGVSAQSWPTKPIRLILPFPPGGPTDAIGRALGNQLSSKLGQQVVTDNRPGAAGALGVDLVAKAAPDGYTIVMATSGTQTITPLVEKVNYDPIKDFAPISPIVSYTLALMVKADSPIKTTQDLIASAKANPGKVSWGTSGTGSGVHMLGEWLASETKTKMLHVPYKGIGPALVDLMAGRITFVFTTVTPNMDLTRLRPIATTGKTRYKAFPNLPTVSEAVPGLESIGWLGLLAPAGTERSIVLRIARELPQSMASPEVQNVLTGGFDAFTTSPDEFRDLIVKEYGTWLKVAKEAGMEIQR